MAAKNPAEAGDSVAVDDAVLVVSSEVGLVTRVGPDVDNGAAGHFAK